MYLCELHIKSLRNIGDISLELGPGFNYFYGDNGAGKTAILEAAHILSSGKSFRTNKMSAVINHSTSELIVRGKVLQASSAPPSKGDLSSKAHTKIDDDEGRVLALSKSRSGVTELRIGGKRENKTSALARLLPVQTLLPEAADLVFAGPGGRRAFLDWGLFHVERQFLDVSSRYKRTLAQRNAWLKSLNGSGQGVVDNPGEPQASDPWFESIVALGLQLNQMREAYVNGLRPHLIKLLTKLQLNMDIEVAYTWGGLVDENTSLNKMVESYSRDIRFGVTHRGPHRGDLEIRADSHPAETAVSRGQAKLLASAFILAQAIYLREKLGTKPIILIDDFGAELDIEHWRFFLRALTELDCQVLATGTMKLDGKNGDDGAIDLDRAPKDISNVKLLTDLERLVVFHVEQGGISGIDSVS